MGTRGVVLIVAASLARCASGFAVTRDVAGSVSPRALRAVPIYSAARSGGFLIGDYSKSTPPIDVAGSVGSYSPQSLASRNDVPGLWPGTTNLLNLAAGTRLVLRVPTPVLTTSGWVTFSYFTMPKMGGAAPAVTLQLFGAGQPTPLLGSISSPGGTMHGGEWRHNVLTAMVVCPSSAACSGQQQVVVAIGDASLPTPVVIAGVSLAFTPEVEASNAVALKSTTVTCPTKFCEALVTVEKASDQNLKTYWSVFKTVAKVEFNIEFKNALPVCGVKVLWGSPIDYPNTWKLEVREAATGNWVTPVMASIAGTGASAASTKSGPGLRNVRFNCIASRGARLTFEDATGSMYHVYELYIWSRPSRSVSANDCGPGGAQVTCEHGGVCFDGACSCPNGWSGDKCQFYSCDPNPCQNSGTCNKVTSKCTCAAGWHGAVCVVPLCGDGHKKGAEACDDGNTAGGDGCSATCVVEVAGKPPPPPPGVVKKTRRPTYYPTKALLASPCFGKCLHGGTCFKDGCGTCDEGWSGERCGSAEPRALATVHAICVAAVSFLMLVSAVLTVVRRHWRPFAARGWVSLFVSHLGGIVWLVSTIPQVFSEVLGAHPQDDPLWRMWMPVLGHGLWLCSNLLYMRAMVTIHINGSAPLAFLIGIIPCAGVWVVIAATGAYVALTVLSGLLAIYSMTLTVELWPIRTQLHDVALQSVLTCLATGAFLFMMWSTKTGRSDAVPTLLVSIGILLVVSSNFFGAHFKLCYYCLFDPHASALLDDYEDEFKLGHDDLTSASIADFDAKVTTRREKLRMSRESFREQQRGGKKGVRFSMTDALAKPTRKLGQAISGGKSFQRLQNSKIGKSLSNMSYNRKQYGARKKVRDTRVAYISGKPDNAKKTAQRRASLVAMKERMQFKATDLVIPPRPGAGAWKPAQVNATRQSQGRKKRSLTMASKHRRGSVVETGHGRRGSVIEERTAELQAYVDSEQARLAQTHHSAGEAGHHFVPRRERAMTVAATTPGANTYRGRRYSTL